MAWYLSLESGQLWLPAQVYNRENGHAGFMLSCYDAKIGYDAKTDTFQARLRAPSVHTLPTELHVSDCLSSLRPNDHIEIQWRKSTEFPYGWWYGVVGHLETCNRNENYCDCQLSDTVILEFNQYPQESRWRRTVINRKGHREEGNEVNGFYGGVRKLYRHTEISTWKSLWPARTSQ
ncbi:hypothetical protein CRG98_028742 [Punica granatum]|uniref:Uncharacterized protein n=1 Tax=Punica granatum TaxID=22663 RepID=A0A2I0J3N2_PUNGR|nr:hypothetical protein CRG98_028742 [Punica granatum]